MKKLIISTLVILIAFTVNAQEPISGIILKSNGKPSKGTEVSLKMQNEKVKTDKEGKFLFEDVLIGDDSLVIKIGTDKNLRIEIQNDSVFHITLNKNNAIVDNGTTKEIVTYSKVGKGKKDSNIITAEDIAKTQPRQFIDIVTRIPGVTRQSGESGTSVYIRGKNSFASSNIPLCYLDNIEVGFSTLANLDVYSIESIEVNKTGFGYGNKGANGVIIVKTKGNEYVKK